MSVSSMLAAHFKRACVVLPHADDQIWVRFRRFVKSQIRQRVCPLPFDIPLEYNADLVPSKTTLEYWLDHANMPLKKKDQYRAIWSELSSGKYTKDVRSLRFWRTKTFGKDEFYDTYKYPRNIQPRDMAANLVLGPIMSAIESSLFHGDPHREHPDYRKPNPRNPEFVKCLPMADRPRYLEDKLSGCTTYYGTDASAFECQMRKDVQLDCELPMIAAHLAYHLSARDTVEWLYKNIFALDHHGQYGIVDGFKLPLLDMRCSGDMQTSLGNGWNNLMFLEFCFANVAKCARDQLRLVVEGDDGLVGVNKVLSHDDLKTAFESLGLSYKFDTYRSVGEAKFCKMVFASNCSLLRDFRSVICRTGWIPRRYMRSSNNVILGLLHLRALSMLHSHQHCPVLTKWAMRLCHLTQAAKTTAFKILRHERNTYLRDQYYRDLSRSLDADVGEIDLETRMMYAREFSISVLDQLYLERKFDTMELEPFDDPIFTMYLPIEWIQNADQYVINDWPIGTPCAFNSSAQDYSQLIPGADPWVWQSS